MKYLGTQLNADGTTDSELSQKLGVAARDFKMLQQVWSYSRLSRMFKFKIYLACIVQKLLYALESAWISTAGKRKLDGFHVRCLRKILGISSAYVNRISNSFVLKELSAYPLSSLLLERQLMYFGHVARATTTSVLHQSLFDADFTLHEPKLKRGRPRDTWGRKNLQHAINIAGDASQLQAFTHDEKLWRSRVRSYWRGHK